MPQASFSVPEAGSAQDDMGVVLNGRKILRDKLPWYPTPSALLRAGSNVARTRR
jgi:hypothetical protein